MQSVFESLNSPQYFSISQNSKSWNFHRRCVFYLHESEISTVLKILLKKVHWFHVKDGNQVTAIISYIISNMSVIGHLGLSPSHPSSCHGFNVTLHFPLWRCVHTEHFYLVLLHIATHHLAIHCHSLFFTLFFTFKAVVLLFNVNVKFSNS